LYPCVLTPCHQYINESVCNTYSVVDNINSCRQLVRKYGKHMKSLQNHGLWWIVLLLYSPTVHTSMSILQCTRVKSQNGFTKSVGYYVHNFLSCGLYPNLSIVLVHKWRDRMLHWSTHTPCTSGHFSTAICCPACANLLISDSI